MKLGGKINRSANSFNDSLNVKIGENSCGKLHDLLKTLLQNRTLEVKKITFLLFLIFLAYAMIWFWKVALTDRVLGDASRQLFFLIDDEKSNRI